MSDIKVVDFGTLTDIPRQLRTIADDIESGKIGDIKGGVMVLDSGEDFIRYGIGGYGKKDCYYILGISQRLFENDDLGYLNFSMLDD